MILVEPAIGRGKQNDITRLTRLSLTYDNLIWAKHNKEDSDFEMSKTWTILNENKYLNIDKLPTFVVMDGSAGQSKQLSYKWTMRQPSRTVKIATRIGHFLISVLWIRNWWSECVLHMESILWMDGSKENERDKLKLTFAACNDGEDVAVFRKRQLCVLVFEVKYNEVNIDGWMWFGALMVIV